MPNHLITTGLQNIYEGITIATISAHKDLTPIVYGSIGNLVTAAYEKDGKRLLIDGGFTRLYYKWDTAEKGGKGKMQPLGRSTTNALEMLVWAKGSKINMNEEL